MQDTSRGTLRPVNDGNHFMAKLDLYNLPMMEFIRLNQEALAELNITTEQDLMQSLHKMGGRSWYFGV